jgi:hypothetical protein
MLFNFVGRGVGKLMPNPRPGNIASEFMKIQRDLEPLFAGHCPISFDLQFERRLSVHVAIPFHPSSIVTAHGIAIQAALNGIQASASTAETVKKSRLQLPT